MNQKFVVLTLAVTSAVVLGMSRPTTAREVAPAGVTRYEYCQYYKQYLEGSDLDRFGSQGWELVSFNTIGEKPVNTNFVGAKEYVLTFKRPTGSGLKNCEDSGKK
jgi:hypothetical protein